MAKEVYAQDVDTKSSPNVIRSSPQKNVVYEQAVSREQPGVVTGYQQEEMLKYSQPSVGEPIPKYNPSDSEDPLSIEDAAGVQKFKSSPNASPRLQQQSIQYKRNSYPATHPYNILPRPTQPPPTTQEFTEFPQEFTELSQRLTDSPLGFTESPSGAVAAQQSMTSSTRVQQPVMPQESTYIVSSQKSLASTTQAAEQAANPMGETYTFSQEVEQCMRSPDAQRPTAEAKYSQHERVCEEVTRQTHQPPELQPSSVTIHARPPAEGSPVTSHQTKQEVKKVKVTSYTTTSTTTRDNAPRTLPQDKGVVSAQDSPKTSSTQAAHVVWLPENPISSSVAVSPEKPHLVDRSSSPHAQNRQDDKNEG